ncbi:MORN repeat-containing protein 3 isoform X2 [Nilaparvata lugens]|uniref:MORN repeat-containing protein 3 isoform X2 n=1 Tax=Nilaparvata lugens TaxID=108931 RepID=UPI00193DD48E|nr:MORN repeat-containing protein 3 isoform X2 [Nilaparvata lugens]
MPFLKPQKIPRSKILEDMTKKSGFRQTVFSPISKTEYIGEWNKDLHSGKGIEKRNNYIYEGDWENGMKHGYGVLSHENENGVRALIFEGEWRYDKKEGQGTLILPDNEVYMGNFKGGMRHGFGQIWFTNGDFYIGDWAHDKRNGKGLHLYGNGDIFEGNWLNDKKHDEGKHYFMRKGGMTLQGMWKNDMAVVGKMEIGSQRQTAIYPMELPITRNEYGDSEKIYEAVVKCKKKRLNQNYM